jgi:RHS repeat-associated protein
VSSQPDLVSGDCVGQYTDPTGYIFLRARYYDPAAGQFLTVDPDVDSTRSAYGYVAGDPLNATDPSGLKCGWCDVVGGAASGAFHFTVDSVESSGKCAVMVGQCIFDSANGMINNYDHMRNTGNSLLDSAVVSFDPAYGAIANGNAAWHAFQNGCYQEAAYDALGAVRDTAATLAVAVGGVEAGAELFGAMRGAMTAAEDGPAFFRGARAGEPPSFAPRQNEFKVDPETGFVRDTHGVSVFDNPDSVVGKGFTPHQVDPSTIPGELRIIQRGSDLHHYEIVPQPGANLTPDGFAACLSRIGCF